jgi:PAS domain S-box-containing protein
MDGWHARALNSLTEAMIAADGLGRVFFLNKAAEALTGWTPEASFGKPLADFFTTGKADALGVENSGSIRTKDGGSLSVMYTRTVLSGEDGEPDGFLIVVKKAQP